MGDLKTVLFSGCGMVSKHLALGQISRINIRITKG